MACLPTAAEVLAWILQPEHWVERTPYESVLEVLRHRPVALREQVAFGLLSASESGDLWPLDGFLVDLVGETGIQPPAAVHFLRAWRNRVYDFDLAEVPGMLRASPLTPAMVPLLLAQEHVGGELERRNWAPWNWPDVIAMLAAEAVVPRAALLEPCLRRLLRGGTGNELRGHMQVYEALDVTVDEVAH